MAKNKPSRGAYAVIILCVGALAFFGVYTPQFNTVQVSGVVAKVAGEEVTFNAFRRAYSRVQESQRRRLGEDYDPAAARVAAQTVDQLVREHALAWGAQQMGIRASDDDVVSYLAEISAFSPEGKGFSPELMNQYLRDNGYSEATFQEELRRQLTYQRLRSLISESVFVSEARLRDDFAVSQVKLKIGYAQISEASVSLTVSPQQVEQFLSIADNQAAVTSWYDGHRDEFQQPERVAARHVLVGFSGGAQVSGEAAERTKEAAMRRAEQVRALALRPGADFAALAREWTDEPRGRETGGDLGTFTREDMVAPFSEAAFALQPGQISDVVETRFGYHVILVTEKLPAVDKSLDDSRLQIAERLIRERQAPEQVADLAARLHAALREAKPQNAKRVATDLGVEWKESAPFAVTTRFIPGIGSDTSLVQAVTGLSSPGEVVAEPLALGSARIVVMLLEKTTSSGAVWDAARETQARDMQRYMRSYLQLDQFEKQVMDLLETRRLIYRNPEYLALDQQGAVSGS